MGQLGGGKTQTLCTIRKPVVWHLELIACASLKDDWDDPSHDDSERPSGYSEMSNDSREARQQLRRLMGRTPELPPVLSGQKVVSWSR